MIFSFLLKAQGRPQLYPNSTQVKRSTDGNHTEFQTGDLFAFNLQEEVLIQDLRSKYHFMQQCQQSCKQSRDYYKEKQTNFSSARKRSKNYDFSYSRIK